MTRTAGSAAHADPEATGARAVLGLGRVVLVVVLSVWVVGALVASLRELMSAGDNAAVMAAAIRDHPNPTGTIIVTGMQPDEPSWLLFSRGALMLGIALIGAVWLSVFARRPSTRTGSLLVVALFSVVAAGTWACVVPATHQWWSGRAVGSAAALNEWMTYDRQAAALVIAVSALAALGLLIIAVTRPGHDRRVPGPAR